MTGPKRGEKQAQTMALSTLMQESRKTRCSMGNQKDINRFRIVEKAGAMLGVADLNTEKTPFPFRVEASSLTLALRLNGHCVFAYGTDGRRGPRVITA